MRAMHFAVPPSMHRRGVAMLAPYSSGLLMAQWDLGGRCCLADTIVSDFPQNLRCGAVRNGH